MLADPICALATPPGRGALAVVRLSGRDALAVAERVVPGVRHLAPRHATLATFLGADGRPVDRGLVTVFPGPASYTGEDLVEFSCHGGLAAPALLLAALEAAGARPAAPGEFTRRAVLRGKLGLLEAEAVGDLVDATTPGQARAALAQLDGGLARRVAALRERLLELEGLLAYEIDFPGEDDGPQPPARLRAAHAALVASLDALLATAGDGERLREGAVVVLAGRPNAGKSSLFNALLGRDRAIVAELPGTTRDAIEAPAELDGWPARLVDTAGLHHAGDAVEALGIEVSRRWLAAADVVLVCVPAALAPTEEERTLAADPRALVVRTKADLGGSVPFAPPAAPAIAVSAHTGMGLAELRSAAARRAFGALQAGALEPMLSRARHREALARARAAAAAAGRELPPGGDAVLAAHHLRTAVVALDGLVGVVDVEQVLDEVFGRFCVGK